MDNSETLTRIAELLAASSRRARALGLYRLELAYDEHVSEHQCVEHGVLAVRHARRRGIIVRALANGGVAEAACALWESDPSDAQLDAALAPLIEEASARAHALTPAPRHDTEEEPVLGRTQTALADDPWSLASAELSRRLMLAGTKLATQAPEACVAFVRAIRGQRARAFASSDGSCASRSLRNASVVMGLTWSDEALGDAGGARTWRAEEHGGDPWHGLAQLATELDPLVAETELLRRAPVCAEATSAIVLSPRMAATLLASLGHALRGDRVLDGSSVILPRMLGRARMGETHLDLRAVGKAWDDEGVAARSTPLVQRGQLVGLLTDRRSAARLGLTRSGGHAVAHAPSAPVCVGTPDLVLDGIPAGPTLDALLSGAEQGLLIDGDGAVSFEEDTGLVTIRGEIGWELAHGRRGRLVRQPALHAPLATLLGRIEAVGAEDAARTYSLPVDRTRGSELSGVAHRAPPLRLRGIQVGASPVGR